MAALLRKLKCIDHPAGFWRGPQTKLGHSETSSNVRKLKLYCCFVIPAQAVIQISLWGYAEGPAFLP